MQKWTSFFCDLPKRLRNFLEECCQNHPIRNFLNFAKKLQKNHVSELYTKEQKDTEFQPINYCFFSILFLFSAFGLKLHHFSSKLTDFISQETVENFPPLMTLKIFASKWNTIFSRHTLKIGWMFFFLPFLRLGHLTCALDPFRRKNLLKNEKRFFNSGRWIFSSSKGEPEKVGKISIFVAKKARGDDWWVGIIMVL